MSIQIGNLGECKVKFELLKKGFEVYTGDSRSLLDMIIRNPKDDKILRVEVKTTQTRAEFDGGWTVRIANRTKFEDTPFQKESVDILAIYLEPIDKVLFLDAKTVLTTHKLTVHDDPKGDKYLTFKFP